MSKKKKILFVFGTRPETIKLASLIHRFKRNSKQYETLVAVTGQHKEMLGQALDLFDIESGLVRRWEGVIENGVE